MAADERCFPNELDDSRDPDDWQGRVQRAMAGADGLMSEASHAKPSIYSGEGGVAMMLIRRSPRDAALPSEMSGRLLRQLAAAEKSFHASRVSFLEGLPGNLALQAALRWRQGDCDGAQALVARVQDLAGRASDLDAEECEVLYGRCGFLGAILFLRRELGAPTLMAETAATLTAEVLESGREAAHGSWPLYYEWHGKCYFGGAHGIAGILFTLLQLPVELSRFQGGVELVRATADRLLEQRFRSGNLPSSEGSYRDRLVHWCHGATGLVPLLLRMAEAYGEPAYLAQAAEAGEVVWRRGLLRTKGPGLCHGIAGNGYALLALHRAETGKQGSGRWLRRARHFAAFLAGCYAELAPLADRPYSMFEGLAGALAFWHDVQRAADCPAEACCFPGYEF